MADRIELVRKGCGFATNGRMNFINYSVISNMFGGKNQKVGTVEVYLGNNGRIMKTAFRRGLKEDLNLGNDEAKFSQLAIKAIVLANEETQKKYGARSKA